MTKREHLNATSKEAVLELLRQSIDQRRNGSQEQPIEAEQEESALVKLAENLGASSYDITRIYFLDLDEKTRLIQWHDLLDEGSDLTLNQLIDLADEFNLPKDS